LKVPFWGFISEVEPAFLSAALIAADTANLNFESIAMRHDVDQAELLWTLPHQETQSTGTIGDAIEIKAILQHLEKRGENAPYVVLHAAAATDLARQHLFRKWVSQKEQTVLQEHQAVLQKVFNEPGTPLVRYGGGLHSIETALYWSKNLAHSLLPLSDLIEKEIVRFLLAHPETRLDDLDRHLCQVFPGLLTPPLGLTLACLESYAEQRSPGSGVWQLHPNEMPALRREDLKNILELLQNTGEQLNYRTQGVNPLQWMDTDGKIAYEFHSMASGMISHCIIPERAPEARSVIVLPGSRANIILYKLHHDPLLATMAASGWTFLKFRHLRHITNSLLLTRPVWEEWLSRDPLEQKATQLEMF
jgi:predicted DNA-binding protein with PD1-like motif